MNIQRRPEQHLQIVRWTEPGLVEDFALESRKVLMGAAGCWRWLLDYRLHGDATAHYAKDLFRTVLPDTNGRFAEGIVPRVAILIGPQFIEFPAQLPDEDFQRRWSYQARLFTDEGQAMAWLLQQEPDSVL